jgi:uncharacterized protein (DUF2164 family)
MRVHEFISEAISASHLYTPVVKAIRSGITGALGDLYKFKGVYEYYEEEFDTAESKALTYELKKALDLHLAAKIADSIKKELDASLPKSEVSKVNFADLGAVHGLADNDAIEINSRLVSRISRKLMDNVLDIVQDSYGEGELSDGLWYILKSIGRNERDYLHGVFNGADKLIEKIASTTVHEVVHVLQHAAQGTAGRKHEDYEYRSYLDKKKGEFVDLHNRMHGSDEPSMSPEEDQRYYKLYMASPQEIASFSHELAISMIKDLGLDMVQTLQELEGIVGEVDAYDFIHYVNDKVGHYYRKPENRKEYAVYKRYVKLMYQEVMRFVQQKRGILS